LNTYLLIHSMISTPSELEAEAQPPQPVNAATSADATDAAGHDRPVRILVQTATQLVPGDKSMDFGERVDAMVKAICHHVWQRDYDFLRERQWMHGCEFAIDNRPCWFLIDHHGPDPVPIPDPPVVWYKWTGTDLSVSHPSRPGLN
jgi:hypothetical protein